MNLTTDEVKRAACVGTPGSVVRVPVTDPFANVLRFCQAVRP